MAKYEPWLSPALARKIEFVQIRSRQTSRPVLSRASMTTTRIAIRFLSFLDRAGHRFRVKSRTRWLCARRRGKTRGFEVRRGFYRGPAHLGKFLKQAHLAFGVLGLAKEAFQFVDAEDAVTLALKRICDTKRQVGRKLHSVRKSLPWCLLRARKLRKSNQRSRHA